MRLAPPLRFARRRLHRAVRSPLVGAGLVFALTLGAVLALWTSGWMQRPEVLLYDRFIVWRAPAAPEEGARPDPRADPDPRIVVIGMEEADLLKYGHPLSDILLAQLLEKLALAEPAVIGLDLYRDLPEPRSGEGIEALNDVLLKHESIVAVRKVGGVGPPPILADRPGRVAANNFPIDAGIDDKVRRNYLHIERDGVRLPSLALAVAERWLRAQGVEVAGEKGGLRIGRTLFPPFTPHAAWYRHVPPGGQEFLIDFLAPPHPFSATVDRVLTDQVPADSLRDSIVLVGTVMESVKDPLPTPRSHEHRGILLHAEIVNQLLRAALDGQRPMAWWSEPAEAAWIALWTALGTALGFTHRSPWKLMIALVPLLAALGLAAWLAFRSGWWVPLAAPVLATVFSAAFAISYVAYLEAEDRRAMRQLFSRHVSSAVADTLWVRREELMDGQRLRPQRAVATILFTDLKGYTSTAEKMELTALLEWMNEYMGAVARHVEDHGGMINSFIGDAIMGVFGAPITHSDEAAITRDAVNAVECALAMERTLRELNEEWPRRGLPTTEMRVGIFTGPVVTGSLGTAERVDYVVFGDSVNTAARLESAGKEAGGPDMPQSPCTICIGDSTFQRLGGKFRTIPLGALSLKGKQEKIIVHRLVGPAASDTPL